jgi:uncharacterized protein (TIGR03435 family)
MKVSRMSMPDIAAALGRQAGRPVGDRTQLEGNFDFRITRGTPFVAPARKAQKPPSLRSPQCWTSNSA